MTEPAPNPMNDAAMGELHRFIEAWSRRHKMDAGTEAFYLATYLAGRLDVARLVAKCKEWKTDEDEA